MTLILGVRAHARARGRDGYPLSLSGPSRAGSYQMVFSTDEVLELFEQAGGRARIWPQADIVRSLHRLRSGQRRCSFELADALLVGALGRPDLLAALHTVESDHSPD